MDRFEELVVQAEAADVIGWDFSWLDGRASEERPPWGYQRLLGERVGRAAMSLDIQTGGGEVLAGIEQRTTKAMVATESWPPNIARPSTGALTTRPPRCGTAPSTSSGTR